MRLIDYRRLIDQVNRAGATLATDHRRLLIDGEITGELRDRLWENETEIISILLADQQVDVRKAALELWGWLQDDRLK